MESGPNTLNPEVKIIPNTHCAALFVNDNIESKIEV